MPQGSAGGASIFNLYCNTLKEVIPTDLQLSGFVDDNSVWREFDANNRTDEAETIKFLESCMITIKHWMDAVRLKMNPSKTEFILFTNQVQLEKCDTMQINVNGDLIVRTSIIHYLDAWMDSNLNFKTHITKKCQATMENFQRIKSVHHLLDPKSCTDMRKSMYLTFGLCKQHLIWLTRMYNK